MVKVVTDKNAAIGLMIVALVFLGTKFLVSLHGRRMLARCIMLYILGVLCMTARLAVDTQR